MRILWRFALALLMCARQGAADPLAEPCPPTTLAAGGAKPVASYRIAAELDPTQHRITGVGTIRWQNPSATPAQDLYLHAYLNAFAHSRTRFMRSAGEERRSSNSLRSPGKLTILQLVAREFGNADLLPRIAPHSPNDPDDATDLVVSLPAPVAPGSTLTLDMKFEAVLPELVERSGFSGSFHAVAQWFPKLSRRDATGTWHHFAYDSAAEFSSDFGNYDVTLDVPSDFIIAAPGIPAHTDTRSNRRRERYCVDSAHDFAWFAWDQFVITEARVGSVELRHYAAPTQTENARITLDTLRWGLEHFGSRLFAYPYESLTIVHPPDRARAAGGMEYPLLITTGGPWYLPWLGLRANQAVALHELAHQWFYGVIASDEYRHPVLDEGLSSWAEAEALTARYASSSAFELLFFRVSEAALRRVQARRYTRRGPLAISATEFGDFAAVAGRVYARFPTLLETIQRVYGAPALELALRHYANESRFLQPTPSDFLDIVGKHLPARATEALSTSLFSDGWVDFAVRKVTTSMTSDGKGFSNRILLERRGTINFPVVLEVEFGDGRVARRHIDSISASTWIEWPHRSPVIVATLDPEHRITIDDDLENQTLRLERRPAMLRLATLLHVVWSMMWSLGWP